MTSYVLGGGCFWCLDAVYRRIRGVTQVETGYAGGTGPANYPRVSTGETGYAETVQVTFDESVIPPETILDIYFLIHDPTTPDRQGNDIGTQYRSVMFYADDQQKQAFQAATARAQAIWKDPIVTQLTPLDTFYRAEDEHQDYFNHNPDAGYCQIVIAPKITKARDNYKKWFLQEDA